MHRVQWHRNRTDTGIGTKVLLVLFFVLSLYQPMVCVTSAV